MMHRIWNSGQGWGFKAFAREIRDRIEVNYLDDRLILEGFLDRYKVLTFVVWLRGGGTVIYPCHLYSSLATVEGDTAIFDCWDRGDVGAGRFFRYRGDDEPPFLYADFVRTALVQIPTFSRTTNIALEMKRPPGVFIGAAIAGMTSQPTGELICGGPSVSLTEE